MTDQSMGNPRWPLVPISDACAAIVDCVNKTAPLATDITPFKMLRTTNVRDGFIDIINCRFVSEETFSKWTRRQTPRAGDVILTREAPLGEVGILRGNEQVFLGQRLISYRADRTKADERFLLYSLMSPYLQGQIRAAGSGATVEHMRVPDAERLMVRLPNLTTQKRIADILSAYDDLFAVNQRRIAILEEIAQRMFDEWFVHFRYPGHETFPLADTDFGTYPTGWILGAVATISEFISRGIAPKYDDEAAGLVINQKCIRGQCLCLEPARRQSRPVPKEKLLQYGDVLINSTGVGTLGRTAQVLEELILTTVDSHVTIVRAAKGVDQQFFGLQLLTLEPHFERQGIGATGQTELARRAIADASILIPPDALMKRFGNTVGPMRKQAEMLRKQNTRLRSARDLLLPKLISGEIEVGRAQQAFAEAAE
jgi:type I restriction enzyme S subunit